MRSAQPAGSVGGNSISAAQWMALTEHMPQPMWLEGIDAHSARANPAWQQWVGHHSSAQALPHWLDAVHPTSRTTASALWQAAQHGQQAFAHDVPLLHSSGSYRLCRVQAYPSPVAHGDRKLRVLAATDIHDYAHTEQNLLHNLHSQAQMLDASVDCIKIIRPDGTLSHMNKSGCTALGVAPDSGFGMEWLSLLPADIRHSGKRALRLAASGKNARFNGMSMIPGHKPQYWDNILTPVKDSNGHITSILCVSRDASLQREAEIRMREISDIDHLTGLPNRQAFKNRVGKLIHHSRDRDQIMGLMLIDLDHFKTINDTLGHIAGDHLLRVLSRRLSKLLPTHSLLARLGGDEFAIAVRNVVSEDELLQLAEQVRLQINAPITYGGKPINGGMSVGCALFPRDAKDTSGLLKCADTALNDMKATGRGGVRMFSHNMHEAAVRAAQQVARARTIVREDLITPHYQPKVNIDTGEIVGFEALLRWWCPDNGFQRPGAAAEAFKDYELATKISDIMQTKVFADIASWLARGVNVLPISINAAPVEFLRDDFAERMLKRLHHYRIPVHLVELEITEYILGDRGAELVARALRELKKAGVRIALDDFGTGHSSFTDLRDYPVDCLKIDWSFVQRMTHERSILAIVQVMCQLGKSLQLDVVAEGIETTEQRAMLIDAGCRIGQGYLFGKAVSALEVEQLVTQSPKA